MVRKVAALLGVSGGAVWRVLDHHVEKARSQESFAAVRAVGIDETACRRGHHYVGLFRKRSMNRFFPRCRQVAMLWLDDAGTGEEEASDDGGDVVWGATAAAEGAGTGTLARG